MRFRQVRQLRLRMALLAGNTNQGSWERTLTFREPLGIIRLATGLVLATILYAGQVRSRRGLLLALLWLSSLALLVRE